MGSQEVGRANERNPTVSWFELFYDLVVVAAVGLSNDVFLHDPSLLSAVIAALAITALSWIWFLTTLTINVYPHQDFRIRGLLVVQMALIAVVGLTVDQEHGVENTTGIAAYGGALLIVATLLLLGARWSNTPVQARGVIPILVAVGICGVASFDTTNPTGYYLIAAMLVTMGPVVFAQYHRWRDESRLRLDHLEERLGLFVLIVIGEGFVQLVGALHYLDAIPNGWLFALVFVLAFAVWWIYFAGTFTERIDLSHVRWRLTLLGHLTLVFGIAGTLDILILIIAEAPTLSDESLVYFLVCLTVVLFSFAALDYAAKGRLGAQGWVQIGCGLIILAVGVILIPPPTTSTYQVIALGSLVVVGNAVIAMFSERRSESTKGIAAGRTAN